MYFSKDSGDQVSTCGMTTWRTQYTVLNDYDYKRCVCDSFGKSEDKADDCKKAEV